MNIIESYRKICHDTELDAPDGHLNLSIPMFALSPCVYFKVATHLSFLWHPQSASKCCTSLALCNAFLGCECGTMTLLH